MARNKKIEYELELETSQFTRSVKLAAGKADKLGKELSKSFSGASKSITSLTKNFALMGAAAAAAATGGIYLLSKSLGGIVESASDLEETQGKFDVVFRGMTDTAEKWSEELQESFILTEQASKKYLSGLQDLLVPTGLARDEAGELAFQFTKLAADLGSFNNLPTEQVIRDIQSALQGSSETMAKYGVNVKAAKVEQEILNQGWAKSKAEITDAQKAQAILNITMRQTADAQGDLTRTSESFANQQRLLKKNIEDVRVEIGNALLPVFNQVITTVNEWFKANKTILQQDFKRWAREAALAVLEFAADSFEAMNEVYKVIQRVVGGFKLAFAGAVKLGQGIQFLFEQSNRLFGEDEKAAEWAKAQQDSARIAEEAIASAAESFSKADVGLPVLDTLAEKTRKIRQEIVELDKVEAKPASELAKDTEKSTDSIEKDFRRVGEVWTNVAGDIESNSEESAKEVEKDWGTMWEEFQQSSHDATDSAIDDTQELLREIEKAAGPHEIRYKVTEERSQGGPVGFARGGRVPGGWGGGDRISALLEPGEFVMRKEAVAKWGLGFMASLNSMSSNFMAMATAGLPPLRMQTGGPVQAAGGATSFVQVDLGLIAGQPRVRLSGTRDQVQELQRQKNMMVKYRS